MKRRDLIKAGGLIPLIGLSMPALGKNTTPKVVRQPNILMFVTDQERHWRDIPAAIPLPGHDWLRERGTAFLNHHVHTTPCSPSRSTIYTGWHTQQTGMISNHGAPPYPEMNDVPTLGHHLRKLGYYTAYKGKWHLSAAGHEGQLTYGVFPSSRHALEPFGFADYNDDGDPHGVTWTGFKYDPQTAANAIHWMNTKGKDLRGKQPWFLAVNFTNPHDVMFYDDPDGQQEKTRLVKDYLSPLSASPTTGVYRDDWTELPMPASFHSPSLKHAPWAETSYRSLCDSLYGQIDPDDEARWRRYQSYYFNCIRDADSHMLSVLRALEMSGMLGDTIIVFTADHGEMAGAQKMRQKGPHMFKENVRVPLIISHPDARHGKETAALSSAIDIVPTLLAMAGARDPGTSTLSASRSANNGVSTSPLPLRGVDLSEAVADSSTRTARDDKGILFCYNTPLYQDPAFVETVMKSGWPGPLGLVEASLRLGQMGPDLSNRGFFRGIHDGRFKYARYFSPDSHHRPTDWQMLSRHNDLELFDTQTDPDELHNIAYQAEMRDKILSLNHMTQRLIEEEIGEDDGRELPGPSLLYQL